ncbi:hypothetical protein DH2020_002423 [Rehmannia glutinosa]|uniref:Retrotransposon Copia-like N-terminal domain-containing protein n=1 Tax=Rehmannia glutinosa TaxID=99300 RepID=A0ABR0XTN9_REHGL
MESPTLTTSSSPITQSQIQIIQPQNQVVTVKLNDSNYLLWKMQVLTAVKGCGLLGYLTGAIYAPTQFIVNTETNETKINPEFESFTKQDQLLASWMLSSLSESVLILVVGLNSSADIWRCLETNFSSQSKARMMQYKLQLQTLKKGTLSMREYLGKAKAACDALASVGQKLSEEDQLLHILSTLPSEYNPVIVTITSAIDFYSLSEASALLLSFESRLDFVSENNSSLNNESFTANVAQSQQRRNTTFPQNNRGRGTPFQRGRGRTNYRGRGGRFFGNGKLIYQVCHIPGHTAYRCYYRYDQNYVGNNAQAQVQNYNYRAPSNDQGNRNNNGGNYTTVVANQSVQESTSQPSHSCSSVGFRLRGDVSHMSSQPLNQHPSTSSLVQYP